MRNIFFALVLLSVRLFADEEKPEEIKIAAQVHEDAVPSLVNLTSLPSAIVNGCVNVITGDLCDSEQDDLVSGPDPYVLGHSYCSSSLEEGNLGDGWHFSHYHFLEVFQPGRINFVAKGDAEEEIPTLYSLEYFRHPLNPNDLDVGLCSTMSEDVLEDDEEGEVSEDHLIAKGRDHGNRPNDRKVAPIPHRYEPIFLSLYEPSGGRLLFKAELDRHHKEKLLRHFKLVTKKSGFTNVLGGQISGQTHIKNIKVAWDKSDDRFTVTFGDGTERVYECMKNHDHTHAKYYRDYQLHKEIKPSGNIVIYHYNDRHEITSIRTYNKDLSHKINEVDFEQKRANAFAKHPSLHVKTSDGLEHVYYFKKLKGSLKHGTYSVAGIKRQGWPYIDYTYSPKSSRHKRRIIKKEYQDHYYIKCKYRHNRVRLQKSPVGPNGQEVITHRYFYYKGPKGGGHTTVRDALGNPTRYYWNKHKRLVRIDKRDREKTLLKGEKFFWGKEGSKNEGCLISHIFYEDEESPKLSRVYSYDSHGNVTKESLYGRFTKKQQARDKITTEYTYSDDGFNLKTSECDTDGNYTYYEYVKGTNLLKAKLICDGKKTKKREFYSHDKNGIMIEKIVDDGSSEDKHNLKHVTERHIIRITPRTERLHFGEPEVIEESYLDLDHKKEVRLSKTVNHFSHPFYEHGTGQEESFSSILRDWLFQRFMDYSLNRGCSKFKFNPKRPGCKGVYKPKEKKNTQVPEKALENKIDKKIEKQMSQRGWDEKSLNETIDKPHAIRPATNKASGEQATAYYRRDGSYVVRDDTTGKVLQISDRNDPLWIPDSTIQKPYTP